MLHADLPRAFRLQAWDVSLGMLLGPLSDQVYDRCLPFKATTINHRHPLISKVLHFVQACIAFKSENNECHGFLIRVDKACSFHDETALDLKDYDLNWHYDLGSPATVHVDWPPSGAEDVERVAQRCHCYEFSFKHLPTNLKVIGTAEQPNVWVTSLLGVGFIYWKRISYCWWWGRESHLKIYL